MGKYLRIYLLILAMLFAGTFMHSTFAQKNDVMLTQQMFSRMNVNPASISISNYIDAFLLVRKQWWGFAGSPTSQVLNLQGYLPYANSGVGASVVSDFFGRSYMLNAKGSYSYHVKTGKRSHFSFGLNAGVLFKNFRGSTIETDDPNDPAIVLEDVNDVKPDFDFGIAFNHPAVSVGVSVTHLTAFLYDKSDYFAPQATYHAFLEARAKFGEKFIMVPSVSAIYVSQYFQAEFSLNFFIAKTFWIGGGYRLNDAAFGMAGVQIKNFRFGYSYDFPLGAAKGLSYGSHEIMLNIRFKSTNEVDEAIQTPRFFE